MEKYLFAAYIFLLGLLLVFILLRGLKQQSKQSNEVQAEERKLVELQIDLQDTILAMEAKIDETLTKFDAQKKDLEALAERIERKATLIEDRLRESWARETQARETQTRETQARETQTRETQTRETQTRETQTRETQLRDQQPHDSQPRDAQQTSAADALPTKAAPAQVNESVPAPPVAAGVMRIKPSAGIGAKNEARR